MQFDGTRHPEASTTNHVADAEADVESHGMNGVRGGDMATMNRRTGHIRRSAVCAPAFALASVSRVWRAGSTPSSARRCPLNAAVPSRRNR